MSLNDLLDRSDAVEQAFKAMRETKQVVYRQLAPQEEDVSSGILRLLFRRHLMERSSASGPDLSRRQERTAPVDRRRSQKAYEGGRKRRRSLQAHQWQ